MGAWGPAWYGMEDGGRNSPGLCLVGTVQSTRPTACCAGRLQHNVAPLAAAGLRWVWVGCSLGTGSFAPPLRLLYVKVLVGCMSEYIT